MPGIFSVVGELFTKQRASFSKKYDRLNFLIEQKLNGIGKSHAH